jgi:hypothetical protein
LQGDYRELGWLMGFEPTTTGITIRDSTAELQPPSGTVAPQPRIITPLSFPAYNTCGALLSASGETLCFTFEAPFECTVTIPADWDGSKSFHVTAFDSAGNTTKAEVDLVVLKAGR